MINKEIIEQEIQNLHIPFGHSFVVCWSFPEPKSHKGKEEKIESEDIAQHQHEDEQKDEDLGFLLVLP
jgi:hypothetical protein